MYMRGYFQDYQVFDSFRSILLSEIVLSPEELPEQVARFRHLIVERSSTLVHLRILNAFDSTGRRVRDDFYTIDREFLKRAITLVKERDPETLFCVFSDGEVPPEVMSVLQHCRCDHMIVRDCLGVQPGYRELELMRYCRNAILSPSTLGWWGAYLAPAHETGIVVYPEMRGTGQRMRMPNEWLQL
jgi:hypothetical protein